jgi:hypothetical protein
MHAQQECTNSHQPERDMSIPSYDSHPRQVMRQNTPQFEFHNFGYHGMQRPHSQMLYAQ